MVTKEVPLIGGVTEQKLVITFKQNEETGEGDITFGFEPDIIEAISPEQRAALNVAEQIINLFGLNREGEQNADTSTIIQ